ncbi:MAG: hypothetical protein AAGF97_15040 [Planctomycetota bacterium]
MRVTLLGAVVCGCSCVAAAQPPLHVSDQVALKAIDRFLAAPLSESSAGLASIIVRFVEESDDVVVVLHGGLLPWFAEDPGPKYRDKLFAAFIAGDAFAQLAPGEHACPAEEGLLAVFRAYRNIQAEEESYAVETIEAQIKLHESGQLRKYVRQHGEQVAASVDPHLDVAFPLQLDSFLFVNRVNFEPDGAGYVLGYRDEHSAKLDIFIFNKLKDAIPDGPLSPDTAEALTDAEAAIHQVAERGIYRNVVKLEDGQFDAPDGTPLFAHRVFQYQVTSRDPEAPPAQPHLSEVFVTGAGDHLVKVRLTYLKSAEASGATQRQAAIMTLAELINADRVDQ